MARSPTAEPRARKYGGLSPEERRRARRDRLLRAALESFGTRGYGGTTIERLCADAGVTARHFYEDFDGRESILRASYELIVEQTNERIRDALKEPAQTATDRIERAVRAFLESYLGDARYARIACIEVVGVSAALEAERREVMRRFAGTVGLAVKLVRPDLADDEARTNTVAMLIVGGANEVIVDWLHRHDPRDLDAIARDFVSLFSAMLRGYVP